MENSTITASTPQELFALHTEAFNAADVDNITSLYESNAVFVYQPNVEPAIGIAAIRQVMNGLLKSKPRLTLFKLSDATYICGRLQTPLKTSPQSFKFLSSKTIN